MNEASKRDEYKVARALKLIYSYVQTLDLNLSGYKILTEVGSGDYKYLPIIASISGADKVYAWTKDSIYGKAKDIIDDCTHILSNMPAACEVIFAANDRPVDHISSVDIITNTGFVRPINSDFLSNCKKGVVIPLMFEAWELRDSDIDINYCRLNNIKVAGTNENFESIKVFQYVRSLALKLALNAGMEVLDNNIIIWSDDNFGSEAANGFKSIGAKGIFNTINTDELYALAKHSDFVFIADYDEKRQIIGKEGLIDLAKIKLINPSLTFIHLYGEVDAIYGYNHGFHIYPLKMGKASEMSETLSYAGLTPIIALQVAGLKVAEEMIKGAISTLCQPITFN